MKALQELLSLRESVMSDRHLALQDKIIELFGFGDTEAEQVLEFALKQTDWEDLGQDTRERLMSHFQKTMPYGTAKAKSGDPILFVQRSLRDTLGL